jgi:hypothetical protein
MILSAAADEAVADVTEREYRRLLGLPRGRPMSEVMRELAHGARRWYAMRGRPFVAARRVGVRKSGSTAVLLESGTVLTSETLAARLRAGDAHALVVVAASAGPEVADEAARLWVVGRPDEAYFLDRLAAAITEGLLMRVSSGMCRDVARPRERLLPHHSPGCGDWDLADQHWLMGLLGGSCGPVTLLASGALRPQHSVLAAFGATHQACTAAIAASPCRGCDLDSCGVRRVPCKRHAPRPEVTS